MLQINFMDFFVRGILEAMSFVLCVLAVSKVLPKLSRFIFSGLALCIITYLIRLLPISYGVHTMLILVVLNIIMIKVFGFDIAVSIKATISAACILFVCEGLNVLILRFLYGNGLADILSDNRLKTIMMIPSLLIFGAVSLILFAVRVLKGGKQNASKDSTKLDK